MIVKLNVENPEEQIVEMTVETIVKGGVIVYPTDTAYGLGGDAVNLKSVERIYSLKGRDYRKPTHVVVKDWEMISKLCVVNEYAHKLYETFMPGPLTLVLPDRGVADKRLGAGSGTLGVRIPNCKFTLALSEKLGRAYTTPSANRSGGKTPYDISEVEKELGFVGVDLVVDGGRIPQVLPSTIIDLTREEWKILRLGPISGEEIEKVLGKPPIL